MVRCRTRDEAAKDLVDRMKVVILSHAYFRPEKQKNVVSMARKCQLKCVLPRHFDAKFDGLSEFRAKERKDCFVPLPVIKISPAQYCMNSLSLGIANYDPDIINVDHNPWSLMFCHALLYRNLFARKAKIVCTMKKNTFLTHGWKGKIKNILAKPILKMVDHIIAASEMVRDLLIQKFSYPERKISICHHLGVDTKLFRPADGRRKKDKTDKVTIGYCGKLKKSKGVEDLIEAVRLMTENHERRVQLALLGAEGPVTWLKDLSDNYSWLHVLDAVPINLVAKFMRNLDIFVLPSRALPDHEEHDGQALLEAMSTGLPCVGTRTGIIPEIIGDGAGLLVEPNAPRQLSLVLRTLINDPQTREVVGKKARQKVLSEASLDVVAQKRLKIYQEVVDGQR